MKITIWQPPAYLFESNQKPVILRTEKGRVESDLKIRDIAQFVPKAGDVQRLARKVEIPAENTPGYIKTYFVGYDKPEKGLISIPSNRALGAVKRIHVAFLKNITTVPAKWFLPLFFLFPPKVQDRFVKKAIEQLGYISDWLLSKYYLRSMHWIPSARSIYHVAYATKTIHLHESDTDWLYKYLMFWVCFMEFDNSYRYRVQDIFGQMNQGEIRKNPKKEILRLLKIGEKREHEGMKKKWKDLHTLFRIAFTLRPSWAKIVGRFLYGIDIKLDEEDMYHCRKRMEAGGEYNYETNT